MLRLVILSLGHLERLPRWFRSSVIKMFLHPEGRSGKSEYLLPVKMQCCEDRGHLISLKQAGCPVARL